MHHNCKETLNNRKKNAGSAVHPGRNVPRHNRPTVLCSGYKTATVTKPPSLQPPAAPSLALSIYPVKWISIGGGNRPFVFTRN